MRPVLTALLLAVLAPAAGAGDLGNWDDAPLHAVQFLDQNEGWAVGDEGVVWHTIDGGRSWERQPTHVKASLRSLHFFNAYQGWVVGREELPQGGSVGVLLYTQDGGVKWNHAQVNALPGLNRVRFLSLKEGFVVGDGSGQFPTGIFRTSDGGRTWKPIPGPRCPGWLAADFQDGETGALVGAWGRLAKLRHGTLATADVEALGGRNIHAIHRVWNRALAVGDGAALLVSRTSGARWGYAEQVQQWPRDLRANLDFHAVYCADNHAWVVGRPGSVVLHSPDLGDTWELLPTRQPLPLNAVFFLNEKCGWAVGELGTILCTRDGGKTWDLQHRGGQRAAILFVHADAPGLPVDTVALVGAEDGYLTTALRVVAPDPGSAAPSRASDAARFAYAVRQAGGAAGEMLWQFPLAGHAARGSKDELMTAWNALHGQRADREMLRQLVLALRIWRPDVVVTDPPDGQAAATVGGALVAEALREACKLAADAKAFPEQIGRLGLEAWQVSKLYARWADHQGAQVALDLAEPKARLETTPRDFATPAATLLADKDPSLPWHRYFHLVDSRLAGAVKDHGLLDGISLAEGGTARRTLKPVADLTQEVVKALRARRAFEMVTEGPATALTDPAKTLSQIGPTLNVLPDDQAANAAFAVANRYAGQGQWTLAREAFILLVDRYPTHPRAADAYRWLIRHNSSSEARRRHELGQFLVLGHLEFVQKPAPKAGANVNPADLGTEIRADRRLVLLGNQEETRQWFRGSLEAARRLAAFGSIYATDPAIQFCLQAARRQLGEFEAAQQGYTRLMELTGEGPWHDAAAAELWLNRRAGPPPKPFLTCRKTATRPFLDAQFDDPCWQDQKPCKLDKVSGLPGKASATPKQVEECERHFLKDYGTEVRMSYDDDFLYLALRCSHPTGCYVPPVKVRPRDADTGPYDRVSLLLDLDRDYSTYFHFQVDQRGCVFEDCWGDRAWNPRWFVAIHSDQTGWQVEAAIPLIELTSDHVRAGGAWACNVVRIVPGRGVQSLSAPAGVEPRPEGMGLLLFQQGLDGPAAMTKANPLAIPKVP
jgi:photosystem II stability/assembly factor-like uncharacterized protein